MGLFSKIKEGLKKTRKAVMGQIESMLRSFTKIDEELFEELEELLVMGDVGVPTAQKICEELRVRVKKEGITDPKSTDCSRRSSPKCSRAAKSLTFPQARR